MRIVILILSLFFVQPSFAITMTGQIEVDGALHEFSFDSEDGRGPVAGALGDNPCIVGMMEKLEGGWSAVCFINDRAVAINIVPMYFADSDVYRVFAARGQQCAADDVLLYVSEAGETIPFQSFRCHKMDMGL